MRPEFIPYLWSGLDLKRYEPVRVIVWDKQKKDYALFMYSKEEGTEDPHWCIEYRGGGKYFKCFNDLHRYFRKRFKKKPRKVL